MKKTLIILGFIASILAVIFAVTPLFKISVFPTVVAFLCGLGILYYNKKNSSKTKTIQYIFLLTIVALSLTIYKSVFHEAELGDTQELEQREEESVEDSRELLEDIDIDE